MHSANANSPESWEVALARLEGKIDTMVALSTAMQSTVTDLDRRVRDVETSMATMKQQLAEIDSQKPAKTNWTAVASTIAACLAVGLVIAERLFK